MSKTPNYFAGKTIIITGAASGVGRATALIFAREGANVVCADINEKGADETAAEVDRQGSRALAIKIDVTKRTEVDDMAERAIAAFGRVQFLFFQSAGLACPRPTIPMIGTVVGSSIRTSRGHQHFAPGRDAQDWSIWHQLDRRRRHRR